MEGESYEACEARRHADNVGYLAGQALQGILAGSLLTGSPGQRAVTEFDEVVNLAARYGEALAKRLANPQAKA